MKAKSELMRTLRKARKDSGLIAVTVYVYPHQVADVKKHCVATASSPKV